MFAYFVRRCPIIQREALLKTPQCKIAPAVHPSRWRCSATGSTNGPSDDHIQALVQLTADRFYLPPGHSFQHGTGCNYGPLGTELKKNMLDQWWHSVTRSKEVQVFGINTINTIKERAIDGDRQLKVVNMETLNQAFDLQDLNKDQLIQRLRTLLRNTVSLRTGLLQGALEQYIPSLELVKSKLPFGLAETGSCFQSSDQPGCPAEVTQTSLVWFCSSRTASQWLDHWARQRLQWWRKFAVAPSDFSCSDIPNDELGGRASRGINIVYSFPWGEEPLETLWSRGDTELLQTHGDIRTKLQCRDGRKLVVPHVVSVTGNMDRGVMAYLDNSLQQLKKADSKQKLHQRKVLKLHPVLAPVKVALDMGRGATVELKQISDVLRLEFLEAGISVWPGYLEKMPTSMEQLNTRYDEMGVLFSMLIGENTLESGLLQVRSRDTTIKETMHISEVKNFLTRYISAANI